MPHDSVSTAASSALDELLEVSPQVDAAVILERSGGRLVASAPLTIERRAAKLAATCVQLLDAAERARTELGREPVSQVEVATPDGHVFVVADAAWIVAAVTTADPTVGLVFYDLKTALRAVREAGTAIGAGSNGSDSDASLVTRSEDTAVGDDQTSDGDDGSDAGDETAGAQSTKWRRKKS
ncbi:MAG: hypothetical protein JWM86_946 [Thermoleophilia bacterium]|nr:hypothetical protein [Thermoleophilia bacterium]